VGSAGGGVLLHTTITLPESVLRAIPAWLRARRPATMQLQPEAVKAAPARVAAIAPDPIAASSTGAAGLSGRRSAERARHHWATCRAGSPLPEPLCAMPGGLRSVYEVTDRRALHLLAGHSLRDRV
jgi:hypothetical protein